MDEDNIIPYQTSPTLTVKQAVMYLIGFRGEYEFEAEGDWYEFDLYDYLRDLQEEAECAHSNASYELEMLKRDAAASPEAIKDATQNVDNAEAKHDKVRKLHTRAEEYRLLINHEISRVRLGKRTPLVVDEDETVSTGELRITKASFLEWLEGMELGDTGDASLTITAAMAEDFLSKALSRKASESLYVTFGLLISMFAESKGGKFGSGDKPNVINIADAIDEYAKKLNDGHPLHGQGEQSIRKRIEIALFGLNAAT